MSVHALTTYRVARRFLAGGLMAFAMFVSNEARAVDPFIPPAPFPTLPATAELNPQVAADIGLKGYHISQIKRGVYWITDSNYHAMAIETRSGVILVDAPAPLPFFPPLPVVKAIAEVTTKPITNLIYSHGHTDHIGGAGEVKAAFPRVHIHAHEKVAELLGTINDQRRPIPDRPLRIRTGGHHELHIDGRRIEIHYFGNTHQAGNVYVWLPDEKIMMVVDVIYPGWVPFRRLALSEDIRGWLKGHDALDRFDFDVLVPGHLTRLGNKQDVAIAKQYNADVKNGIDEIYLDANQTLFAAIGALEAVHGSNTAFSTVAKWALFSLFYDFSTKHCADKLDAKYTGVLAGAETFNFSNCEAYFVALRLGDVKAPGSP